MTAEQIAARHRELLDDLKRMAEKRGYRFVESKDGRDVRMMRPDGSVALIVRGITLYERMTP